MQLPPSRTPAGDAGLAAIIAEPARTVVALDFDGTLAAIVDDPAAARPVAGALDALGALASVVGCVAIITGRPAGTLVELAGLGSDASRERLGRLVVLGHYGVEQWSAVTGRIERPEIPPGVAQARAALPGVLRAAGAPDGTSVEDKQAALAVHVRRTPDPDAALRLLRPPLAELAERTGLQLEPGRMVLELRPVGSDKGGALIGLVRERKASVVLFAGDDLGDRAAFAAIRRLRAEGVAGVAVCSASDEVNALAGEADLVVDGPTGVVAFLGMLAAAIGSSAS